MLAALNVICGRFLSVNTQLFKISSAFIPTVIAGCCLGPVGGAAVAAVGDLVGALLFPTGAYFFPFTLSAALGGAWYGLMLRRKLTVKRLLLAVLPEQLVCSLMLNGLFLSMLIPTKGLLEVLVTLRLPQLAINLPVQLIVIPLLVKRLLPRLGMSEFVSKKSS